MAKSHALIAAGLFALAAGLVGCQQSKPVAMVDPLPNPNFGGPIFASPVLTPPGGQVTVANTPPTPNPVPPKPVKPAVPAAPVAAPAGIPREWVPVATANSWRWIVIHHSATTVGGAARFAREHQAKGWDELGYHFVIGNGSDTGSGTVEVGSRWPKQKWGAHAKTPDNQFNEHGIGICLVGDFDQGRPSDAQLKSLAKLTAYLMKTYHVPPERIIGHGDTKATHCPGRNMNIAAVRRLSVQMLAASGEVAEPTRTASAAERLTDPRAR